MVVKCIIRQMKLSDINSVMELNIKFLPENYYKEFWLECFDKGKNNSFVASVSGVIVGYVLSNKETIVSFAVDDRYRNNGIGINLLYHCLNSLKIGEKIILYCRSNNKNALSLYKKIGFNIYEIISDYYINPVDDGLLMETIIIDRFKTNKKISLTI